MKEASHHSTKEKDTYEIADIFLKNIKPKKGKSTVVFLKGNLGAGKTTFSKALAKLLGVKSTVISPTFILQKKYKIKNSLFNEMVHIDAYRFEDPKESEVLDLYTTLNNEKCLMLIEWPERIGKKIKPDYTVKFSVLGENQRKIQWK